jgi:hypothetical protein
MQLARFRRSGDPADLLVVKLPAPTSIPGRRPRRAHARAACSVLRVTDGVSRVPALGGNGVCAVLRADQRTRTSVERRLRKACPGELQITWASSPEDGVTLDALLEEALNGLGRAEPAERPRTSFRPVTVHRLLPRSLDGEREPMRTVR